MKVLLVDPPFHRFMGFYRFYYPLGLAYLAAVLEAGGHEVAVYDAEHAPEARSQSWAEAARGFGAYPAALKDDGHPVWNELRRIVEGFGPDLVGVSMLSVKAPSALRVASLCRQIRGGVPVVAGADHATAFPDLTLASRDVDVVVRGEGERSLAELVASLESGSSLANVDGISFRENGRVRHTPPRALLEDLDTLPFPAIRTLIGHETYRPLDFGALMGSRGCPYACSFCGVQTIWSRRVRCRSVANVLSVIGWLRESFGTEFFSFRDASFTLDRGRVLRLCDGLGREQPGISWECTTRPDLLDDTLLDALLASGCVNVRLGVESGSERILGAMRKEVDLDEVRATAARLNRRGAYWSAYFLFGTPKETRDSIRETLAFIEEIDPPFVTVARYAPIPGSEMYHELEQEGLVGPATDWGLEGNQRPGAGYASAIPEADLERILEDVGAQADERNRRKSAEMGMSDRRLKG